MRPCRAAHLWYESTVDGFIDEAEFLSGLERLGLNFGPDSLALSNAQKVELMSHVFTNAAPTEVPLAKLVRAWWDSRLQPLHI